MVRLHPEDPSAPTPQTILTEQLRQLVPDAFTDGEFNPSILSELLISEGTHTSSQRELFGLNWTGKAEARRLAMQKPKGSSLKPMPGEGVDEETTQNVFIEGDNLEVLKLLREAYADRVKVIYIDPPYNTGKDFIYKDDFSEPIDAYLRRTGEKEDDQLLVSNPKSQGRFHSNWLNFMYPRLRIAKDLLADDGIIFISIDDNEIEHLKMLMNEIFGPENFVTQIIVQSNKRGQTYKEIAKTHEYLLCFTKTNEAALNELNKEVNDLNFEDEDGEYNIRELRNRNPKFGKFNRPNLFFPIYVSPNHKDKNDFHLVSTIRTDDYSIEVKPYNKEGKESCWRWSTKKIDKTKELNNINKAPLIGKQKKDGGWNIYEKYRKSTYKTKSIWDETDVLSERGTLDLKDLGMQNLFDHPKPVNLIAKALQISTSNDDIIVDFFAGSGTTAQAVMKLNSEDDGSRKFICIQLPVAVDASTDSGKNALASGFKTLSSICKERMHKAAAKIKNAGSSVDLGFKVFKLDASTFRPWKDFIGTDVSQLEITFAQAAKSPLVDGWKTDDLLFEIMLLEGFPLHSTLTPIQTYEHNQVIEVSTDFCSHHLLICLDEKLHLNTLETLEVPKDDIFICLDTALTDQAKVSLNDRCKIKTI